jgi:acyl carrier protein
VTRSEVETTVRDIFEVVLKRPIDASETLSREAAGDWDSVRHIELLFMLEEEFGITFDEDEMAELQSFGEIVDSVLARTADGSQE